MENITIPIQKDLKSGKSVITNIDEVCTSVFLTEMISFFVPKPEEGSPRILLLFSNDDQVREMGEILSKLLKPLDLTVDLILEKGKKLQQRNDLFDGTEVIIGTTRRVCELYFQNGFNVKKLKFFASFHCNEQFKKSWRGHLVRIMESLPKARILLHGPNLDDERFGSLEELVNEALNRHEME
jgi:ATP-dependent RNA helicase RhlE